MPRTQSTSSGSEAAAKPWGRMTLDELRAALQQGNCILATRAFPFPHRYYAVPDAAAGMLGTYDVRDEVKESRVLGLLAHGWAAARMLDRRTADRILYTSTEARQPAAGAP